jgi:hypothetical protein
MTTGKGKRPRDWNRLAQWIVEQSTGEAPAAELSHPFAVALPVSNTTKNFTLSGAFYDQYQISSVLLEYVTLSGTVTEEPPRADNFNSPIDQAQRFLM